ncbi:MAG: hypothetical protein CMD31_10625 [Flavobacteriales bacterium]|nr:hypothetical protein [Flavobacteriales bacterium]|tara:strand:+ start:21196 stop:22326 length:1131 start_codon:yes stop_codon:yes gene_type:complete
MNNKPTVFILGKLPPPFIGPAIATQLILNSELKNKFNLTHFDTRINADVASMGKWSFNKAWKSIQMYFHFLKKINQYQPDLILVPISQTTMGFIKDAPFILLGKWKNKKVVIQLRGSNFKNWLNSANSFINFFIKKTLKNTNGVIVLGKNLKYLFSDFYPDNNIFVVPNGANYHLEKRNNHELNVLYFANFLPSKSFDDILKAVLLLKEKNISNFQLNAAGAWDNKQFKNKCLNFIEKHQLNNVTILPPQSGKEKMQLFANSDVFVFCPKMPEGHPWVIVEAMANSLPIIATNQGAIIESVIDGKNGFIVPSENPTAIAEKLEILLTDKNKRSEFSNYSKMQYKTYFTEEKMVENLEKVFETCIAPQPNKIKKPID